MLRSPLLRRPSPTPTHLLLRQTVARQKRTLIPAPQENSGPLMSRRADRALPSLRDIGDPWHTWRHVPLFLAACGAAGVGIFNYQKASSSVVTSSLYALRMSPLAREMLGEEIYFAHRVPWIWGKVDTLHGVVDVSFKVKGRRSVGMMRFRCSRPKGKEFFETLEWSLQLDNGEILNLLNRDTPDPIAKSELPTPETIH